MKTLLIDHSNLAARAFYATYRGEGSPILTSRDGFPTNAIHTWGKMLRSLCDFIEHDRMILVLDGKPARRLALYPDYKSQRGPKPEPMTLQLPVLREIVMGCGLEYAYDEAEEADDIIASLAQRFSADGEAIIVSGDKDFAQCVTDRVTLLSPMERGGWRREGAAEIEREYGVTPARFAEYLALIGDTSDNIPGIDKIGPKTAVTLISKSPDVTALVAAVATKKKWSLEQAQRELDLNLKLTRAGDTNPQVKAGNNWETCRARLEGLGLHQVVATLTHLLPAAPATPAPAQRPTPTQGELF